MVNEESHMLRTMAEKYRPSSKDDTIGQGLGSMEKILHFGFFSLTPL